MSRVRRIGVLTGGGDAPGLNAVIRAIVKSAHNHGIECIGLEDSFDGLIEPNRSRLLSPKDVTGILRVGGTILGTTRVAGGAVARSKEVHERVDPVWRRCDAMFHQLGLDGLVVIGGDGTLAIAHEFSKRGMPLVGVPKTIDNDIVGTTNCFGFDTAVSFATDAIDRLHTTAEAHHRVMVAEVMGRYAGWIALYAGIAGGADAILIPEIPFSIDIVAKRLQAREKRGARFSIVVAAEGAAPKDGKRALIKEAAGAHVERLGGVGRMVAAQLEELMGKETRSAVLGHLQRGGAPTSFDRTLATRFGAHAVELLLRGETGQMVAFHPPNIVGIPLADVVGKTRNVPLDSDVVATARALGITFGDEE
jgi:phosphofructokinase-like protein